MPRPEPDFALLDPEATPDGKTLPVAVHLPPGHDPGGSWPAILFLHGVGECGTDGRAQTEVGLGPALRRRPASWPFVVLMPQKPFDGEWEDLESALLAAVDAAVMRFGVDPDRVALTGVSHGGHGAWALAQLHPQRWSALVPLCGYLDRWPRDGSSMDWEKDRRPEVLRALAASVSALPVWAFHGEADPAIPVSQTQAAVAAIRAIGGDVRLNTLPGVGHECWESAYALEELPEWMAAQRRRGSAG